MKKLVVAGCAALALCAANAETDTGAGASLTVNQVRQRYPWNGLVDIDYTIECAEGAFGVDDNLEVLMIDNSVTPAATNRAITFLQAPLPMTPGKHRITWDAHADGITKYAENAMFRVKITHYNDAYMVIDVSGGPNASVYPVKFLNAAPVGGFNKEEYKTDKIVLRRIHAGSYMAGSPTDEVNRQDAETQHRVALSKPFYIGVFEVTQKQYMNVMNENPSEFKDEKGMRPVEKMQFNTLDTFMTRLLSRCLAKDSATGEYALPVAGFCLPTEFQWEYACRAGTTGAFNTTNAFDNTTEGQQKAIERLGRYSGNKNDIHGCPDAHTIVGSYEPNQWGLYDMHGNVWEFCSDIFVKDPTTLDPKQYRDPTGATSGTTRVLRSGGFNEPYGNCRTARRGSAGQSLGYNFLGFRLCRTLP